MANDLGLTNKAPLPIERPVNEKPPADQVFLRHRPPIAAVVTVIAVVAHREIAVRRNNERAIRRAEKRLPRRVALVRLFRSHHPSDTESLRRLAIDVELGRIDPQLVARRAGESLDVK